MIPILIVPVAFLLHPEVCVWVQFFFLLKVQLSRRLSPIMLCLLCECRDGAFTCVSVNLCTAPRGQEALLSFSIQNSSFRFVLVETRVFKLRKGEKLPSVF